MVGGFLWSRGGDDAGAASGEKSEKVVLGTVGASDPYWQVLVDAAADEGIDLEVKDFADYTQPNPALSEGELDINQFQHLVYLAEYNVANDDDIVPLGSTAIYPLGLYSSKVDSVEEIQDGDTVVVPDDDSNQARALLILQSAGLITLEDGGSIYSDARRHRRVRLAGARSRRSRPTSRPPRCPTSPRRSSTTTSSRRPASRFEDALAHRRRRATPTRCRTSTSSPAAPRTATTRRCSSSSRSTRRRRPVLDGVQDVSGGTAELVKVPQDELQASLDDVEADTAGQQKLTPDQPRRGGAADAARRADRRRTRRSRHAPRRRRRRGHPRVDLTSRPARSSASWATPAPGKSHPGAADQRARDHPPRAASRVGGREITALRSASCAEVRLGIGMIFQQFNLFRSRTVAGNIAYPLEVAGVPDGRAETRGSPSCSTSSASPTRRTAYLEELSGGQKQRVGIARALATNAAAPARRRVDQRPRPGDHAGGARPPAPGQPRARHHDRGDHPRDGRRAQPRPPRRGDGGRPRSSRRARSCGVLSDPQQPVTRRFVSHDRRRRARRRGAGRPARPARRALRQARLPRRRRCARATCSPCSLEHGVRFELVFGGIEEVQGETFGNLTLALDGDPAAVDAAVAAVRALVARRRSWPRWTDSNMSELSAALLDAALGDRSTSSPSP